MSRLSISIALVAAVQALAPQTAEASCDNNSDLGPLRCGPTFDTSAPADYKGTAHFDERTGLVTMDMDAEGADNLGFYYVPEVGAVLHHELPEGTEVSSRALERGLNSPMEIKITFDQAASKEFSHLPIKGFDGLFVDKSVDEANQGVPVISGENVSFEGSELTGKLTMKIKMSSYEHSLYREAKGFSVNTDNMPRPPRG